MKRKVLSLLLVLIFTIVLISGCANQQTSNEVDKETTSNTEQEKDQGLKDGKYLVKTEVTEHGNFSMAVLEVKDEKITSFDYNEYFADSGDVKNESNYAYAEGLAVIKDLNAQFNESKDLNKVNFDALTGATYTKNSFKEVTQTLLDKASLGETYTEKYKDGEYQAKATEPNHGWLAEVNIVIKNGQIIGVDYAEVAVEDMEGIKVGDRKSVENYSYPTAVEVAKSVKNLVINNNGTENLDIDAITGATSTKSTVITLIDQALSAAK